MANTNCLKGIKCPNCGQEDEFYITGIASFKVTDDGSDEFMDLEWGDGSGIACPNCHESGEVKDFTAKELV